MRSCPLLATAAAVLAVVTTALAQWDDGPPRDHQIVPEDYFTLAYVTTAVIAPDGSAIAYVEQRWEPPREERNADLWVVDVDTQGRTRLTFDPATDEDPQWSPDGRWIYFTSARGEKGDGVEAPRNGTRQVWRVQADGGPAMAVTREADGIGSYQVSERGRALYFTTRDDRTSDDRWAALRQEHAEVEYGDGQARRDRLHRLDLETWRTERLVDEGRIIREFRVSADGARIAMITAPDEQLISFEGRSAVDVWSREGGVVHRLPDRLWRGEAPSPYGWLVGPAWSDDGTALAFSVHFDGYPAEIIVAELDAADPRLWRLERPDEVHVSGGLRWRPGGRDLCLLSDWRSRRRVYTVHDVRAGGQGTAFPLTPWDVVVHDFSFGDRADDVAIVMSGLEHLPDVFTLTEPGPDTEYVRLTNVNPQVDRWMLPQIEQVRWTSADGTEIEGILELPPGYRRGDGPLPTVVHLHGGPTSATRRAMQFGIGGRTLFAARGWALLSPNYRGSIGFGDTFLTELIGRKNELDVADILSGVDSLVARGIADPERLAVMGWSNGGYLTNCVVARTDRFKAASSGAGVFDTAMQWSLEDTPGHVVNFQRGLPWQRAEEMQKASALYDADRITTPMLIHVGERDERVPAAHSRALYRALHRYLGVPAELVVYPGAGHGLTKLEHRRTKIAWDVAWLDYWVKP